MKRSLASFAVLLLALSSTAYAAINVAVLGSPNTAAWNTEVQNKLIGTGQFSTVDAFLINIVTPTLAQLNTYDAVLVYSNGLGYADSNTLGNNLADYVDGGGGVVAAVFANASIPFGGRWASDNYWALQPASQIQGIQLTLGTINDPSHPAMAGVNSFDGGTSSYRSTGSVHASATVIAEWSNSAPLVIERTISGTPRIDLNFFPPSTDSRSDFWVASTDGEILLANSLSYVGGATVIPEPATIVIWSILVCVGLLGYRRRRKVA